MIRSTPESWTWPSRECSTPTSVSGCSSALCRLVRLRAVPHGPGPEINDLKAADAATVERLSEEAAVLLKNDGAALPLQGAALSSVAVIGPIARQTMVEGNRQERARGFPERDVINPLQVLQALAPSGSHFTYAPGIDWIGSVVPASALSPGLTRTESDSNATRTDATIDYKPSGPNDLKPGVTYTWTGTLTVPVMDTYYLWLQQAWLDPVISFSGPSVKVTIDGSVQPLFTPGVPVSTYPRASCRPTGPITGCCGRWARVRIGFKSRRRSRSTPFGRTMRPHRFRSPRR